MKFVSLEIQTKQNSQDEPPPVTEARATNIRETRHYFVLIDELRLLTLYKLPHLSEWHCRAQMVRFMWLDVLREPSPRPSRCQQPCLYQTMQIIFFIKCNAKTFFGNTRMVVLNFDMMCLLSHQGNLSNSNSANLKFQEIQTIFKNFWSFLNICKVNENDLFSNNN